MTVKRSAFAALSSLVLSGAVQAAAIDIDLGQPLDVGRMAPSSSPARARLTDRTLTTSELPEPEVFTMMLVGLILIGYRVSRDSSDKFE
jgi:hypothetical protein